MVVLGYYSQLRKKLTERSTACHESPERCSPSAQPTCSNAVKMREVLVVLTTLVTDTARPKQRARRRHVGMATGVLSDGDSVRTAQCDDVTCSNQQSLWEGEPEETAGYLSPALAKPRPGVCSNSGRTRTGHSVSRGGARIW